MSTAYIRFSAGPFSAHGPAALQRSPLLERLLADASQPVRIADWRADAFRVIALDDTPMPPIAPTALHAAASSRLGAWVCVATPIHASAGSSSVMLPHDGILTLAAAEAAELALDFNRVFTGVGTTLAVGGTVLLCVFDSSLEVTTRDPAAVAGCDVFAFQPSGLDGPRLRRLMSEMEMWLFEHAVNRARAMRGQRVITGLWLWGGGELTAALPAFRGWAAGQDPFFAAFGAEQRFPPDGGAGVAVCAAQPGSEEWPEVERRWLAPGVAALESGRIERLELSAADRRFSVAKGPHLRFWRRPRPWWESYDIE